MHNQVPNITRKFNWEVFKKVKKKNPRVTREVFDFIMDRFIFLSIRNVAYGRRVFIPHGVALNCAYRYWQDATPVETFSLTPKVFGIEFFLVIETDQTKKYGYQFIQGDEMKPKLEKYFETDLVYEVLP